MADFETLTQQQEVARNVEPFELTQEPMGVVKEESGANSQINYLVLRHTGTNSMIKIYYKPGKPAQIIGRGDQADFCIPFPQVSTVQALVISLGSGIFLVDVGRNGMFVKLDNKRIKLPVFPHKPPFPEDIRPKMTDMFGPLKVGMLIQIGNSGPGMDELGVQCLLENCDAEYEVLPGEGVCGVGEHSRAKRKAEDKDGDTGGGSARKSVRAAASGQAAKKRRKRAKSKAPAERHTETQRNIGSKGSNLKYQTFNKRATKKLTFNIYNAKTTGENRGKGGKGRDWGNGKGKGGKGKGKGKGSF
jgi:hypothetical protein